MEEKIKNILMLLRIGNGVVIGFAALTGYVFSGGKNIPTGIELFLSAMLIGLFGNIINDIFDIEIDKINKPWRPLPSGKISIREARVYALLVLFTGLIIAIMINILCFIVAVLASILLYIYSKALKKTGFSGNLLIAFLSFLVILYGGLATSNSLRSLYPGIYAFLIILGREIYKGIEDVEGDRRHGIRTIASILGIRTALYIGTFLLLIVVVISPLPYMVLGLNLYYLIIAVLGVDLPIIYSIMNMYKNPIHNAWRTTRILKIPLLMGLLAFFMGVVL